MKAYFVDDIIYSVEEIEVKLDFKFEGQFKYFETEEKAREELLKVIQADIDNLEDLIKQETEKQEQSQKESKKD